MWRRMAGWYRAEYEQCMAVLAQPALAVGVKGDLRRCTANNLASMTSVQRQQLLHFMLRYRGWRGFAAGAGWVAVFSALGLLARAVLAPAMGWVSSIVCANFMGFAIMFLAFSAWFDYRRLAGKTVRMLGTVIVTAVLGTLVSTCIFLWSGQPGATLYAHMLRMLSLMSIGMLAVLMPTLAVSMLRNRHYDTIHARLQQQAEQERLARELSESQLRLLRAQIEPHFLFNTLGAVQQLAQHGAPRAAELTASLIDFLRGSMRDMRSEHVTLAAEFGVVESYLKVMQTRMGERLRYTVALPRALEQVQVPSMIVLTLAENAIKHGIEPALRGGEMAVSAEASGDAVTIRVHDSGVGMSSIDDSACAAGTGLDNIRRRLALAYGSAAGLALRGGEPTGLAADITIPLTMA